MSTARLGVLSAVVVILVAMVSWWQGAPPEGRKLSLNSSVAAVGNSESLSSTWFCSAGGIGAEPAPQHLVRLTNSSEAPAQVRVSAFNADGKVGEKSIEVPGASVSSVDVSAQFKGSDLSVMVESPVGSLAVGHTLVSSDMADSVPCETHSSDSWYFPAQTTLAGSKAVLVLFNPFSADAGVVVSAAVSDGVRSPSQWDGIVVPAGTTKVVDLGEQVQRRDQFSVEVKAKSGRILAETVQLLNLEATDKVPAVHGLRLLPGVANARQVWTFAGGFKDPGAHEKIVVQNPGADPASVSVQVVPYGAGDMPPEPFLFEVPARRYFVLDLTGEGRIPDVGFHSIRVESSEGDPVVAVRTSDVSAGPPAKPEGFTGGMRPAIDRGATTSLGSPFDARSWLIPSVSTGQGNSPIALIHNPGSGIVRVTVTAATDGGAPVDVLKDAEVAAGDGLAVGLSSGDLGGKALRYYKVVATGPISVDQFKTFASVKDYSIGPALPITP